MASFHLGILPNRPLSEFFDLVTEGEDLGFCGAWVADSQSSFRDGFMALTLFAARTKVMQLATGVTNIVTRHPAVLAHSFATLDEFSGGRAILGIGVGESAVYNIGKKPARLKRLEEVIQVIRGLIAGKEVDFEGEKLRIGWSCRDIPVVMACTGPRSLQLAGRIADGVLFQVGADPKLVKYAKDNIQIGAKQAGRDISGIKLYQRVACVVADDRDSARESARAYTAMAAKTIYSSVPKEDMPNGLWEDLAAMNGKYDYRKQGSPGQAALITDKVLDSVAITGTPDEVVEKFSVLTELGISDFVIPVTARDPGQIIRSLSQQVVARL